MEPQRGEVWWVSLDPTQGSEIKKTRPCLATNRPQAGRLEAKRRGVKLGRKPKLSPQQVAYARKLIENGESPKQVAQLLGVARSTLYAAL